MTWERCSDDYSPTHLPHEEQFAAAVYLHFAAVTCAPLALGDRCTIAVVMTGTSTDRQLNVDKPAGARTNKQSAPFHLPLTCNCLQFLCPTERNTKTVNSIVGAIMGNKYLCR